MDFYRSIIDLMVVFIAWTSIVKAAPVPQKVNDHPSTYRRVKMAHKFGVVAVDAVKGVYLTTNTNDPNTLLVLWAYGPQTHRIQGESSGLNIAMNSAGKVYATTAITTDTLFRHSLLPNHRHIFEAKSFKGYFLGFNRQRLPKKGNRARIWKNDRCYFQVLNPSAFSQIKFKSALYKHFEQSMRG
eukprot:Seg1524.12 transcript_id=Seg1524.12/GoldUCD/mRNA.D3Y31 product="Fibroblast growth factor 4" protein_id=Seg1524.12/GoldUCD/D3Y31